MRPFDDILIHDELEKCPYLPERVARMPLHVPTSEVNAVDTDQRLAAGQRRTGDFVYQTKCPNCNACQSIRIPVDEFVMDRTMRRTKRRNDQLLEMDVGRVQCDQERAQLFNLHRKTRGLGQSSNQIDPDDYQWAFGRTCFDTFEIAYRLNGELVCLAIVDQGDQAISAVYTFYDPLQPKLSLGTYSILKQIEFCQHNNKRYLYLGFFIGECKHMTYKARFLPHERLINGDWHRFE